MVLGARIDKKNQIFRTLDKYSTIKKSVFSGAWTNQRRRSDNPSFPTQLWRSEPNIFTSFTTHRSEITGDYIFKRDIKISYVLNSKEYLVSKLLYNFRPSVHLAVIDVSIGEM